MIPTPHKVVCSILMLLLLAGCSTTTPLSASNPAGIRLAGEWVLDAEASDIVPDTRTLRKLFDRPKRTTNPAQAARRIALGSDMAFVAQDFEVLRAQRMVIEMNADSMGVHYHPGVYRDVSWGQRDRGLWDVRAGWLDDDLLIESRADGLFIVERFTLQETRLTVQVEIDAGREDTTYTRIFHRR